MMIKPMRALENPAAVHGMVTAIAEDHIVDNAQAIGRSAKAKSASTGDVTVNSTPNRTGVRS